MPARPISELESLIGTTETTARGLRVETGKVDEFARAITDRKPEYFEESAAKARGLERIPAPPTFLRTWYFDRYRPRGVGTDFGFDLGLDPRYTVHGQQEYRFRRPVYVGDVFTGETTLADVYRQSGNRGGEMTFVVFETEYLNQEGNAVVEVENTRIETSGAIEGNESGTGADPVAEPDASLDRGTERRDWSGRRSEPRDPGSGPERIDPNQVSVGDTGPKLRVDALDRSSFVRYAGASGDFNPIHYDEPFARRAGHPSVFAQGMLVAGVASRFVTDWTGVASLTLFRTRFTSQVWPGDSLAVTGEVTDVARRNGTVEVTVEFRVTDGGGDEVLIGDAEATYGAA